MLAGGINLWQHMAMTSKNIAIIGGGPAGLAAAEAICTSGHSVTIYEAMPTPARKFLLAGKSGLNMTHAEAHDKYLSRFGAATPKLQEALDAFIPGKIRAWASGLGVKTFIGSSGRVFPKAMKASPLLRAWLARLEAENVKLLKRHKWVGFDGEALVFETPDGKVTAEHDGIILALGGASWPRLGATGEWSSVLTDKGIAVEQFRPANCGFDCDWSDVFKEKFAGNPIKSVIATSDAGKIKGEFVVSASGIEGSLIYTHSAALRNKLDNGKPATLELDLAPGRKLERLTADLEKQKKQSLSNRLRKGAKLTGVKASLIRELAPDAAKGDSATLAKAIKSLKLPVKAARPIEEAISSAGGVRLDQIDQNYMLTAMPGVFVAGEMLDWEAPTGGYLISGCLATGQAAGKGLLKWLDEAPS